MIKKAFLIIKEDLFKHIGYTPLINTNLLFCLQFNVPADQVEEVAKNTTIQTVFGRYDLFLGLVEGITYRLKATEPMYNVKLFENYLTVVDGELVITRTKPEDFLEEPTDEIKFRTALPERAGLIRFSQFKEDFENGK